MCATLTAVDELTRLLLDAQAGDRRSLAAFIRSTQADVWRMCAHLVDREHADDVTQDIYVRAWQALPRFRADATARTWLLAIARRACADAVRSLTRRRRLAGRLPRQPVEPDPAGPVALHDLVDRLDPQRGEAFVLTQILGLSYREAAEVSACEIGTIRSRVARARAELLEVLDAGEQSGS